MNKNYEKLFIKCYSDTKIPDPQPTFEEISKQMNINAEIIMKRITDHANKEIERVKKEMSKLEMD